MLIFPVRNILHYGDNQFATPITLFPSLRNQEKYQFRYDVGHATGDHSFKFGVNFIHEPVLAGAFPGKQETLYSFPNDPTFYAAIGGDGPEVLLSRARRYEEIFGNDE